MDTKALADAVQRWSGVGTFVVAAMAVVAYMTTREDRALDAESARVAGRLDSIDETLKRLDARSIEHLERLAKIEARTAP